MSPIPLLTLRLLDIELPDEPEARKLLLTGAKDLLRTHGPADDPLVDRELFHNQEARYSGIQLGSFQGAIEWTAIGQACVKTLDHWYQLFAQQQADALHNTVEIRERYTPEFLPYLKRYQIRCLLISDELARSLNPLRDRFARFDRLEKYLYGNLQTFFQHIGFQHDKQTHFLKIQLLDLHPFDRALPVYHQQKKTAFSVTFECNFRLPQTLRLGQATAIGYGKLQHR
ncbi:MAG: CRISPR-associated endonuclease Cas6 [Bacteroidota bacterium]